MAKILQEQDSLLSFDIKVAGAKLNDVVEVCEIAVQREVNRIASATIIVTDGGPIGAVNEPFTNSEGKDFIPGNEIEIALGYGSTRTIVFKGLIISQRLVVKQGKARLVISCKDKAVTMTNGRFNGIYKDAKDSDTNKNIIGKYGLQMKIDATANTSPVLMQYNCSDWDFIVTRAEMNNRFVLTDNNTLVIKKIDFGEAPEFEIDSSQFVIDIDLSLESEMLFDSYHVMAWDDKQQITNEVTVKPTDSLSQGNLSVNRLSKAVDSGTLNHYSSASLSESELKSWGSSLASKAELSKVQGSIKVPGTADIKAGDLIKISGFSKRFNGKALISKVTHDVKEGDWITTLHVGRPPKWHSALPDVQDIAASGLIPAANGFQIAKVQKIHEDPDGNYHVLVTLPSFSGTGQAEGLWARLSFPYASSEAGFFFFPEINDEVLINFINNDPRFPVITGSVYSAKNKPKEIPDAKNRFKAIHSKSGIVIRFDDEDKILALETPGGNSFILDDKEKRITLKDTSGNSLIMDDSGIILDSIKDIKLSAKGDVEISASGGFDLKANSDVKVDGGNVALNAKTGFAAKGNATAEISASGQTTVKGAMVMIN